MLNFSKKIYVFNPKRFSIDFIEISLVYGKFKLITNWKVLFPMAYQQMF